MTIPPACRPIVSSFLVALLVAGLVQGQVSDAPTAAFAAETLSLTPGASLEREIRGGETESVGLRLDTGTFLFLEITPRNVRLSFRLLSPGGEVLSEADGLGPHLLAVITDREGIYRLEYAASPQQRVPKRFRLKLLALRPAVPEDQARIRGAKALAEARHLLSLDEEQRSRAEALLAESLTAWQEAGDFRGEVEALVERAKLQSERGEISGALTWWKKALDRAKENDYAEGEARALAGTGFCNSQLGHHDEAIRLYLLSLEILRRVGGPFEQASTLVDLGIAYQKKQDFQAALQAFEGAQPLAETAGDLALKARVLTGVGAGHFLQYRLAKAKEIWEQSLELSRRIGDPQLEADLEQNLATIYLNEGLFQKALDLFTRSVARASAKESGMARYNMGNLYLELGDPEKARENYQLSQQAFQAKGSAEWEANALIGIGWALQRLGKPAEAIAEYEKARLLVPAESWNVAYSIGRAQIDLGRPEEALPSLQRALGMAQANGDRSREAATLLALGSAHAALGQPEQALEHLGTAIAIGSQIGYQSVVALAFLKRSLLRRDQRRLEEALADVENALVAIESTRRNIAGDQLRTGFFAAKRTYYDLQIELLMQLDQLSPRQGYAERALAASEMSRSRSLLDMLVEGRIDLTHGIDPALKQKESDVTARLSRIQARLMDQLAKDPDEAKTSHWRAELDVTERERQEIEWQTRSEYLLYTKVRYPSPLRLEEIQKSLPKDTALLEYFLGQEISYLFVVTREHLEVRRLLQVTSRIADDVRAVRDDVERTKHRSFSLYSQAAHRLYQVLIAPVRPLLVGKRHLMISTDGPLQLLAFEALLTEEGKGRQAADLPYLLRDFSISYIPSANVLSWIARPRLMEAEGDNPPKQFIAFADPFFSSERYERAGAEPSQGADRNPGIPSQGLGRVRRLKGTAREVTDIAALYPTAEVQLYLGEQANEGNVKANPLVERARHLHFATHGVINERQPELSGLRLTRTAEDDGILQVHEIFNLGLNAELVVLSACDTGLGKEVTGEGLMGMTRAFIYAGTPNIVVSLWEVADTAAPGLMLQFYKNMRQAESKAEALRQAKLTMIRKGTYISRPFYWAPFILVGRP